MKTLESIRDHVIFELRYNQIYQLKTTKEKGDKCKEMKEAGECTDIKVAEKCYKTCYNCGYFGVQCKDKMPSKKCKKMMKAGKCEDEKIAKKCMKTCDKCEEEPKKSK